MKSLTTLTTLFYFTTLKMKSLSTPTTLFYLVSTIKMESLTSLTTLFYFTAIKMKSPTTLFYFTTIKIKSLTTLTTLFYFTTINVISLTTLTTLFKFTTIKMKPLRHSLCCITSLLLTREIALPSLCSPYPSSIFLPRNLGISIKFVCATVISPSECSVES